MSEIIWSIVGWVIIILVSLGVIGLFGTLINLMRGAWNHWGNIKVYYDDNDHSKGYYWVSPPGKNYPLGYPKEQILKEREEYERLKKEQKAKAKAAWHRSVPRYTSDYKRYKAASKKRPEWVRFLFEENLGTIMERGRRRKLAKKNQE